MNQDSIVIGFEDYKINCIIGCEPHERLVQQDIFVDVKVQASVEVAARSDDIRETVNYMQLALICREVALTGQYFLLEKYGAEVINKFFEIFPVSWAWIRIKKPAALPGAVYTFVELQNHRKS